MASRLAAWLGELAKANRGIAPLVPLGCVVLVALLLLAAAAWQAAARVDLVERASEERLVRHALDDVLEALARSALQLTAADRSDARSATTLRLDVADPSVGRLVHDGWGFDLLFV